MAKSKTVIDIPHGDVTIDGIAKAMPLQFAAFICPHCDGTHIEIGSTELGISMAFVMMAGGELLLADMIVNAQPIDPKDLHQPKRGDRS